MLACLKDRVSDGDAAAGVETLLMVVGAGRGPLVRASLRAADRCDPPRRLRVFAVEKNPNAVVTLQSLVESEGWGDRVTVVASDMRTWDAGRDLHSSTFRLNVGTFYGTRRVVSGTSSV